MLNREKFKSFIYGFMTYFILSVVLDLLNVDNSITKVIILIAVILVVGVSYSVIKKKK